MDTACFKVEEDLCLSKEETDPTSGMVGSHTNLVLIHKDTSLAPVG